MKKHIGLVMMSLILALPVSAQGVDPFGAVFFVDASGGNTSGGDVSGKDTVGGGISGGEDNFSEPVVVPAPFPFKELAPSAGSASASEPAPVRDRRTIVIEAPVPPPPEPPSAKSAHYELFTGTGNIDGEGILNELEERFELYNRLFHFDPAMAILPLRVRVFGKGEDYDRYVSERLGYSRPGAVYIHYREPERRELILHRGGAGEERILAHQGFIQFLRAFVANPPVWIRDGFALYFNTLRGETDAGEGPWGIPNYEEDFSWFDLSRKLGNEIPSVSAILLADVRGHLQDGEILSWALVSFLLQSGREDYFRALIECFMVLDRNAAAASNAEAVMKRISLWTNPEKMNERFHDYVGSRRIFANLVADGRQYYDDGDFLLAEICFRRALGEKSDHYLPYYYLGLLSYETHNYDGAEDFYRSALKYGADPAQTAYARGLNALSGGRTDDARNFLETAAAVSPERYREPAGRLGARLE